jgi:hypothetical protein
MSNNIGPEKSFLRAWTAWNFGFGRGSTQHGTRTERSMVLANLMVGGRYCCLADFASPVESKRKLVGAVGIENTPGRNFKDLEEMPRRAKTLKGNNKEREGILNGPSIALVFFSRRNSFNLFWTTA